MNFNPLDLTAQPLNFGKGPSILEKWWYPKKTANFEGEKKICARPKKNDVRKWICRVLFAKEMKKICQIWPRQTLKHFTAAYRGLPPCTQSQHPINRETGYSNVLVHVQLCIPTNLPSHQSISCVASSENIWHEQDEGTAQVTTLISLFYLGGDRRKNPNDKTEN